MSKGKDKYSIHCADSFFIIFLQRDFLSIELVDGKVRLTFELGSGPLTMTTTKVYNTGTWYKIALQRNKRKGGTTVLSKQWMNKWANELLLRFLCSREVLLGLGLYFCNKKLFEIVLIDKGPCLLNEYQLSV